MSQHRDAKCMECKDNVFLKSSPLMNDMFTVIDKTLIQILRISFCQKEDCAIKLLFLRFVNYKQLS